MWLTTIQANNNQPKLLAQHPIYLPSLGRHQQHVDTMVVGCSFAACCCGRCLLFPVFFPIGWLCTTQAYTIVIFSLVRLECVGTLLRAHTPIRWLCKTQVSILVFVSLVRLECVGTCGRSMGGRGKSWELRVAIVVVSVVTGAGMYRLTSPTEERAETTTPTAATNNTKDPCLTISPSVSSCVPKLHHSKAPGPPYRIETLATRTTTSHRVKQEREKTTLS
jgi:hypothetical protein